MNQDALLAIAYFEEASSRLLGEPLSLGTKIIRNSIIPPFVELKHSALSVPQNSQFL
jgi:hypothetical protein